MWRRMASVWPICSVWYRYSDARELSRHSWSVSSHARMPSRTLRSKSASVTTQVSASSYICVFILLYMCPHPPIYVSAYCCYICVRILLRSKSASVTTQASSSSYICVLMLLYMCGPVVCHTLPYAAMYVWSCCLPYASVCCLPYASVCCYMCGPLV